MTAAVENESIPSRPRRPAPPSKLAKSGVPAESAAEIDQEPESATPSDHDDELAPDTASVDDTRTSDDDESDDDESAVGWVEGDAVEIIPGSDPFTSTLSLIAETEQLGVWVRLTPTAIQAITAQLAGVLALQQQALSKPGPSTAHDKSEEDSDSDHDSEHPDEDDESREGMIRRARDPLGLRFIPGRSSRAVWYIAGAVLVLAVVAAVLSKVNP